MSPFRRGVRQALTIARRDLVAMVMTPTFLLFLLSPLLILAFGAIGSVSATSAMTSGEDKQRIVIIAPREQAAAIMAADARLRDAFNSARNQPELRIDAPGGDVPAAARALLDNQQEFEIEAILYGPLERPHILRTPSARGSADYLSQLAEEVLLREMAGASGSLSEPEVTVIGRVEPSNSGRGQAAQFATLGIFILTLMLASQAVGAMTEERSNKIIEVLAAAVPLESVFFGKLLGTFGSALIFVGFWGALIFSIPRFAPAPIASGLSELGTAVGPIFPVLFVAYFAMSYLLQSALYVGIGSQASTQREIQMLSLPITIFQFGMFGLASYGTGNPGTWIATFAEVFPFSSPMSMVARAANEPELWPHALALLWQGIWVAICVTIAARMFRFGVLKSGSPKRKGRRPAAAI